MKLKLSILLTLIFSISATAFGQKEVVKPTTQTKPTADAKPADAKAIVAKMPTAQEILTKYAQALGGKTAHEKIKSRTMKGTMEIVPMGIKGSFESYAVAPNKSLTKSTLAGIGELVEGFDGQTAWTVNPLQGNRDKQGEELAQTKLINNFYREVNLAQLYPKMEQKGTEKVGEANAYVLVGTPESLTPETFYFDTKSGLLVRQDATFISPEGKTPTKTFFEDFREVDGVKLPFKMRTVMPQFEIVVTITEIKNNVAIEDSKFTKPKI